MMEPDPIRPFARWRPTGKTLWADPVHGFLPNFTVHAYVYSLFAAPDVTPITIRRAFRQINEFVLAITFRAIGI